MSKAGKLTPAMQQYEQFKKAHPDCVLFFRMGDFYEMFFDDAKLAHKVMGVTLTQRTEGVPMAGVPYHAVDSYLRRMIQAGYRVAVCDQIEDAATATGPVVKRDVTRVITPGTLTDDHLMDEAQENPLAAVMFLTADSGKPEDHNPSGGQVALAWAELSTGAFSIGLFDADAAGDELARISPRELLYVETADRQPPPRIKRLAQTANISLTARPAWQFRQHEAVDTLKRQYQVATLTGFGLDEDDPLVAPAAAIIAYLLETQRLSEQSGQPARIAHLQPPRQFHRDQHLVVDQVSLASLEVQRTMRHGEVQGSLLGAMQDCRTAMGKRLMRHWLCYPLADRPAIEARQAIVQTIAEDARLLDQLRRRLDQIQDVARIIGRLAVARVSPRDLVALGQSVQHAKGLADLLDQRESAKDHHQQLTRIADQLDAFAAVIAKACVDAPPAHLREGGLFRDGHDAQLDEYRSLQKDSQSWLANYQKSLIESTGIGSLKIGFNKVFGFYIELSAANREKAPDNWTRKQTLKNAERFITPELKDYEGKVLTAEQRAVAREQALFQALCEQAQDHMDALHHFGRIVAELDVLASFARRAVRYRYVRPVMVDDPQLHIVAGRHPVLDERLGDQFVPNDVNMGGEENPTTLALITGPNMAGKSTYIRQTALIVLLAHTGSFVPAERATVGLCDRIFTRVGASDELHAGQSTFMVEMSETANICHHATEKSLVVLDEIGRGTSTLDGLSLAWAITEHLAALGCRTLFATHYHELTDLAQQHANVVNLNVSVREWQDEIVFLHRIVPGATDRSYGIHVAKIAGLPRSVVKRADEVLAQLQVSHLGQPRENKSAPKASRQMSLFTEYLHHPAMDKLASLDLDNLRPIDAFDELRRLKKMLESERP